MVNLTTTEDDQTAQLVIETDSENQQRTYVFLSSSEAFINVREESESNVSVVGGNLPGGNYYDVDVALPSTEASNVTVESIGSEINNESFETDIQNSETAFNNSLTPDTDEDLVQYVQLEHEGHDSSQTFDNTSLTYTIDASSIPDDTDPEDVILHRYNTTTGDWKELTAERTVDQGESILFEVQTPGFSEFAVTAPDGSESSDPSDPSDSSPSGSSTAPTQTENSSVSITGSTIDNPEITAGDSTRVTLTVENQGDTQEEVTLDLTANGEIVATATVTIEAGSSTEVTIPFEAERAGEYTLTVNGETVGTVTVASNTDGDADENNDTEDASEADDSDCELFGLDYGSFIVCWYWWLLAAMVGLSLVLYRLRQRRVLKQLMWRRDGSQRNENNGDSNE